MTTRATPQQNGVAEHLNETLEERITAMFQAAELTKTFWADALRAYMEGHISITTSAVKTTTPFQLFQRRPQS